MKIIDLLNKIANDEEVPKKIKYDYKKFEFIGGAYEDEKGNDLCYYDDSCMAFLTDEVEIIEEEKKIPEKINCWYNYNGTDEVEIIEKKKIPKKLKSLNNVGNSSDIGEFKDKQQLNNNLLKDKLNEIIDCLDYLKSKGE